MPSVMRCHYIFEGACDRFARTAGKARWSVFCTVAPMLVAASVPATSSSNGPFFQHGRIELRPHLSYNGSYNEGLLVQPGLAKNSYIDAVSAGFLLNVGSTWSVDYTPTLTMYSNPAFRDVINHTVVANGAITAANFALGLSQSYAYSAAPLVETGRQTDTESIATDLTATRALGRKLLLQADVQQRLTFVASSPDFHQWSVNGGVQSSLSSRLTGSIGVRSGYDMVFKSADMIYVQPGGQISWNPISKLSLNGGVSLDERVVLARKWSWRETPLYSGSIRFEPFSVTHIKGRVSRAVAPSLFAGQTADSMLYSVSGEQRFLQHIWLGGGLDYTHSDYLTTGRTAALRRKDNIWTYRVAARTSFLRRGAASISYQDSDNNSNLAGFGRKNKRIACEISYRY